MEGREHFTAEITAGLTRDTESPITKILPTEKNQNDGISKNNQSHIQNIYKNWRQIQRNSDGKFPGKNYLEFSKKSNSVAYAQHLVET